MSYLNFRHAPRVYMTPLNDDTVDCHHQKLDSIKKKGVSGKGEQCSLRILRHWSFLMLGTHTQEVRFMGFIREGSDGLLVSSTAQAGRD